VLDKQVAYQEVVDEDGEVVDEEVDRWGMKRW
jgi:hypothetical protein